MVRDRLRPAVRRHTNSQSEGLVLSHVGRVTLACGAEIKSRNAKRKAGEEPTQVRTIEISKQINSHGELTYNPDI